MSKYERQLAMNRDWLRRKLKADPAFKARRLQQKREYAKRIYANPKMRAILLAKIKDRQQRIRSEVIAAYGSRCVCCGEQDPKFLTIDHVNNDGASHRKKNRISPGAGLYSWLRKRGFPKKGFQLLCWNCNCGKGIYGLCPHKHKPGVNYIRSRFGMITSWGCK